MPITVNGSGTIGGLNAGGLPDATVTPADLTQPLTLGTAKNATGTSIDFSPADSTGIPSWAKRVTVMFNGVSTNGSSNIQLQVGSTTIQSTGYTCGLGTQGAASNTSVNTFSSGFTIVGSAPADLRYSILSLNLVGSNIWICSGTSYATSSLYAGETNGVVTLSGVLDRIRITTVNGTDTFDAGTINIMYE